MGLRISDAITDPTLLVPGMPVTLHHEVYGNANYVVEGLPYFFMAEEDVSGRKRGWYVMLRHENSTKAVEHSLDEIGVTKFHPQMWVTSRAPSVEAYLGDSNVAQ